MSSQDETWMPVIARALAYLALHKQELGNAGIGEKSAFLEALGLPRSDIAAMLNTTVDSIAELLRQRRKKGKGGRRGKKSGS
jgi:hypothetical protein